MRKFLTILLGAVVAILCFSQSSMAQDEGNIKIKITKEINGERKTFEGSYGSKEEMESDPRYREFVGEDQDFHIYFGGDDEAIIEIEEFKDEMMHFFHFSDEEDEENRGIHIIRPGFHNELNERVRDYLEELNERIRDLDLEEFDRNFRNELHELLDELDSDSYGYANSKKLRITYVDESDFGKKGVVKDAELLELEDLRFYPNPSDGKLNLRFRTPQEGELEISVYDLDGKSVFNDYFQRFGGVYREEINLSDKKDGIYLLEIKLDNRRLTRKIVIN